ncbi:E3 ubiquitin-protein ligase TRIM71 [Stylophora pistillata]|uniref:E3 ubiquitin-protein ligase TRIM71 n=1 Tax=Stylophora pistillata TaxID=50429 RepID=A0A2B4RHV4_STYPI|nr:E3 ubiquitin-protein ligase TRIM71 [Stylophora pistillata]
MMESLLKNLKEHVTCSICLDTYTKPKTIACLHTFCCECLKRHALTRQKQGLYPCPECQAQIRIPEGKHFDNLPNSFLHNSLVSLLAVRRSGEGNEISCDTCQKKSAEINYCFECKKFMCPDCVKAHEVFRDTVFQGHKITPVRQFQATDYEALLKRQSFCSVKYHEREVSKFFCVGCQTCVCPVCIATDHKNHDVVLLEKAADDEKANIIALAQLVREKKEVCRGIICEFEKTEAELEANITSAKRQVTETAEQMMGKLRQLEREGITALERARVSRIEKLNAMKTSVVSLEKQLDQAFDFSNNLVMRSSSSDIMQNKKNVEERVQDLIKTKMPTLPVRSSVEFVSTCEPESLSLGFMKFSETDMQVSTVKVRKRNIQAGVEAELLIFPKKSEGEIRNTLHRDRFEVQIDPADKVRSLVTSENEGRGFQVKFEPKIPGTYEMELKINGRKLFECPVLIPVKARELNFVGRLDFQEEVRQGPTGIAVNSEGVVVVAHRLDHCILVFEKTGKLRRKFGCHGNKDGQFDQPVDITFINDDEILVADQYNHRIQQLNVQTGDFVKSFGKKGSGDGELQYPIGVCVTSDGRFIVVVEYSNSRIQVFTMDGKPVLKFGDSGSDRLDHPIGCVCYEDKFIATDSSNNCVKVFDSKGQFLYKFGEIGNADGELNNPYGVCVDKYGEIVVCDKLNNRIQMFTLEGTFIGKTMNSKGVIAVADNKGHCILVFDETEKFVRKLGSYGDKDGQFNRPADITFLKDDKILVADEFNHRIQRLNVQTGNFVKSNGKRGSGYGELHNPTSVSISRDELFIVVADFNNSKIQMFILDGKPELKYGDKADDEKANIIIRAELVKQKKEVCRDVIREFEKTELELEANITTAEFQVSQVVEQMIRKLRQLENETITAFEKSRASRIEKLHSGKESLVSLEKQLDQVFEFSNNLVERSSSSDIMQNKKNVEERIEDLIKTTVPALPVSSFVEFVSTCEPESLSLGFTKFCETHVPASTVEGLDQNFQAGVDAELLICPKSSEGETKDSQHTDRVEVHIEPADRMSNLLTSEKEDGEFGVKFVAKVPGTYEMDVKINGQKLAKSPFLIPVKARQLQFVGKLDFQEIVSQHPAGIAVNSKGVMSVAGCKGHCILVLDEAGNFRRKLGCYGDEDGQFNQPVDITFINDDEILVVDSGNHRIQQLNIRTGNFVKSFGKEGSADGDLKNPSSVCITSDGGFIAVAEFINSRIQVFTMDGKPVLKFGNSGSERLDHPLGCICYEDKFIVTDTNNNCVKVFDRKGQFLYKFGEYGNGDGRLDWPCGLSVDKCGNVFLCDRLNNRIQQFTLEGTFIGKTSTDLKLQQPWGITTLSDDRILITEFDGEEAIILK